MLTQTFSIRLGQPVLPGLSVIGKFDGKTPSLASCTTGGKILLHSPHEGSQYAENQLPSIRMLNFNRKVTSIASGKLGSLSQQSTSPDLLLVGTQSNLLAYDVERNADVFFREVPDGVNSIVLGRIGASDQQLAITGGNCSILGFDKEGNEAFWTVTSDNVSSITMNDINRDGLAEIIVGSDDFEIRIFSGEEIIGTITEVDKIVQLARVPNFERFAYSLANGTLGVYAGLSSRLWRVKTKHKPVSVVSVDINADGVDEVVSGWSNGGFNVRSSDNGEVLFRSNFKSSIASVLHADYKMDGKEQLVVVTDTGEMKGFAPADAELNAVYSQLEPMGTIGNLGSSAADLDDSTGAVVVQQSEDQVILSDLQLKKLELMRELKDMEESSGVASKDKPGALPAGSHLTYQLVPDPSLGYLGLHISIASDVQIINVVAIDSDSSLFEGTDILTVCNTTPNQNVILPIRSLKNVGGDIAVQTHVSLRSSLSVLHVFEAKIRIPKFAAFKMIEKSSQTDKPTSEVIFYLTESITQFVQWLTASFVLNLPLQASIEKLKAYFVSVNNSGGSPSELNNYAGCQPLHFNAAVVLDPKTGLKRLAVRIRCNSIDLAADLIQDIAKVLNVADLESVADFPEELLKFNEILKRVEECNAARVRVAVDMADDSQRVKALIIKAEDSRLMIDMPSMRRAYTELQSYNEQLVMGYNIRAQNHEALLTALKEVNQMIQRTANLRVGKPKSTVISECRGAVKANNFAALTRIMSQGTDKAAEK